MVVLTWGRKAEVNKTRVMCEPAHTLQRDRACGMYQKIRRGQPDGARFVATVHARTLRRAAEICGGEERLAVWLGVTPSQLSRWIDGLAQPPTSVFLRAVDLVIDHRTVGSETTAK
jgi:hypothetical protein